MGSNQDQYKMNKKQIANKKKILKKCSKGKVYIVKWKKKNKKVEKKPCKYTNL